MFFLIVNTSHIRFLKYFPEFLHLSITVTITSPQFYTPWLLHTILYTFAKISGSLIYTWYFRITKDGQNFDTFELKTITKLQYHVRTILYKFLDQNYRSLSINPPKIFFSKNLSSSFLPTRIQRFVCNFKLDEHGFHSRSRFTFRKWTWEVSSFRARLRLVIFKRVLLRIADFLDPRRRYKLVRLITKRLNFEERGGSSVETRVCFRCTPVHRTPGDRRAAARDRLLDDVFLLSPLPPASSRVVSKSGEWSGCAAASSISRLFAGHSFFKGGGVGVGGS